MKNENFIFLAWETVSSFQTMNQKFISSLGANTLALDVELLLTSQAMSLIARTVTGIH
jgi:hypothetical protein